MAKKVYEEQNISNIASAIRDKTGSNKTYKTSEMVQGINEVYEAGYETGKAEGGNTKAVLTVDDIEIGGLGGDPVVEYETTTRARTQPIYCTTEYPVSIQWNSDEVKYIIHYYNNNEWIDRTTSWIEENCEDVTQLGSNPKVKNDITHIRILFAYKNETEITDIADFLTNFTITKWIEPKTYEEGIQDEYDKFWDNAQDYGNRTNYNFAFSADMWTLDTFKPKYPLQPTTSQNMFAYWGYWTRDARFDFRGLPLDLSKSTSTANCFTNNLLIQAVGVIDVSSAGSLQGFFNNAQNLETVEKFILRSDGGHSSFTSTFAGCKSLRNITFEGVIDKNIDFSACPLTHDSLMSIINALKDGVSQTLTLGTDNLAKLTDAEKAIATDKGWTLA